jgi:preprotein translocase subunit SecA
VNEEDYKIDVQSKTIALTEEGISKAKTLWRV